MRALAQQMGKEKDYEALVSENQPLLPPAGASEIDVKTWQVICSLARILFDFVHKLRALHLIFLKDTF